MTKKLALADMVQPIGRVLTTVKRLDSAFRAWETWAVQNSDDELRHRLPKLNIDAIQEVESRSVKAEWVTLELAAEDLKKAVLRMTEHPKRHLIEAAVDVLFMVFEDATKNASHPNPLHVLHSYFCKSVCRASVWLSFVDAVAEWESLSELQQKVLYVLSRDPGLKQTTVAERVGQGWPEHRLRADLSKSGVLQMRGLIVGGRGQSSAGYRLTDRGKLLVELSR
jgi:hypothetical protein